VWSKEKYSADNWMIDVTTKITGRLKTGADGMVTRQLKLSKYNSYQCFP